MAWLYSRGRVSDTELLVFTRHLSAMLSAGIPIIWALTICHDRCGNQTLAKVLKSARDRIAGGATIASSLVESSQIFSPTYRVLIEAGEGAGMLDRSLDCLTSEISARIALRQHLRAAAIYPTMVLFALIMVTLFLLVWVIPTFEELFSDVGASLPLLTRVVLSVSRLVSSYGVLITALLLMVGALVIQAIKQNQKLASRAESIAHTVPLLRSILTLSASARMSSTLGTLIQAGIPIIDALATTARVVGSGIYAGEILRVRDKIANGSSLASALGESSIISTVVVDYISVGEHSGRLDVMLHHCAAQLERELAEFITRLQQLVEPVLILTIGAIVGILVLAMYLPIFQIGELLTH